MKASEINDCLFLKILKNVNMSSMHQICDNCIKYLSKL